MQNKYTEFRGFSVLVSPSDSSIYQQIIKNFNTE